MTANEAYKIIGELNPREFLYLLTCALNERMVHYYYDSWSKAAGFLDVTKEMTVREMSSHGIGERLKRRKLMSSQGVSEEATAAVFMRFAEREDRKRICEGLIEVSPYVLTDGKSEALDLFESLMLLCDDPEIEAKMLKANRSGTMLPSSKCFIGAGRILHWSYLVYGKIDLQSQFLSLAVGNLSHQYLFGLSYYTDKRDCTEWLQCLIREGNQTDLNFVDALLRLDFAAMKGLAEKHRDEPLLALPMAATLDLLRGEGAAAAASFATWQGLRPDPEMPSPFVFFATLSWALKLPSAQAKKLSMPWKKSKLMDWKELIEFLLAWPGAVASKEGKFDYNFSSIPFVHLLVLSTAWQQRPEALREIAMKSAASIPSPFWKAQFSYLSGEEVPNPDLIPLPKQLGIVSVAPWEAQLQKLESFLVRQKPKVESLADSRITFRINYNNQYLGGVFEQKRNAKGWSEGRSVALKRLFEGAYDGPLSAEDRGVLSHLRGVSSYYGIECHFEQRSTALWRDLSRHPLVFLDDDLSRPISISARKPLARLEKKGDSLSLVFSGLEPGLFQEAPYRYYFHEVPVELSQLREQCGDNFKFPLAIRARVAELMNKLGALVEIHSELSLNASDKKDELAAGDSSLRAFLDYSPEQGLSVMLRAAPLGLNGPLFPPGLGASQVSTQEQGQMRAARRDLKAEKMALQKFLEHPDSSAWFPAGSTEFNFSGLDNILPPLDLLKSRDIEMAWPQGKKISLRSGVLKLGSLNLSLKSWQEWLQVEGGVEIEGQNLALVELLQGLHDAPSGYIKIGEGDFIRLEKELLRSLQSLEKLAAPGDGKSEALRIHQLLAHEVNELIPDARKMPKRFRDEKQRLEGIFASAASLPSSFKAELRPYQLAGFQWLMRLAEWGAGACLADDMGLGKTIQSLALLSARQELGPSLIIAPSSVCFNWENESARFAPSLRLISWRGQERSDLLDTLQAGDLVICSYALLSRDAAILAKRDWNNVILDEAQAIKNPLSQRAKAAKQLKARFRLATTGTPVENNLRELWSLFDFLNPGLLHSLTDFETRYRTPIEQERNDGIRLNLRQKVSPFILRRLKRDVLTDLPPRTEITLRTELSPEERGFYEKLRLEAITRVQNSEAKDIRLQVLAEITRLRLAACHPKLVDESWQGSSTKMDEVRERLHELLLSGHQVLVFSQFLKHLALLRDWLQHLKIPCCYLDGSTPVAERQQIVSDFQSGKAPVFLISLKAGGTGLNLTAADYVFHLDPWWNPATEDQASDRAHRLGQQRPVTVYRFVSAASIEEKILSLHQSKRDLADSLLSGSDQTAALSVDALVELLQS